MFWARQPTRSLMGAKRKKRIGGTVGTHAANAANIASLGWFVCQKVSASQNLAGSSFLSRLLIFYPPRFSTQEERGIAFLHLRFGRGRDSVLKFLRAGNPYRSGRLATNLSSIYSRPHTTYPHTTSLFHTRSAFDHPIYTVIDTILSRIIFSVITHHAWSFKKWSGLVSWP